MSRSSMAMAIAGTSASALALYMLLPDDRGPWHLALLGVALVAFLVLVLPGPGWSRLPLRTTLVLSTALLLVAVVARPNGTDLWYYQLYGRIVVEYEQSPYEHAPAAHPNDPVLPRTGGFWDGVRAEYGPVFVVVAAGVAAVTQTNELAARLAWQGLAGLAVFLAMLLVARRTRSGVAVAMVGLNPLVVYSVVNAGHNDALVGLAVLGGVLLASRDRDTLAALAMAAAALVKAPAGIALVALLAWIAYRRGIRETLRPAAAALGVIVLALGVAGGRAALAPMLDAASRTNRHTVWNLTRDGGWASFRGRGAVALGPLADFVPTLALAAGLALAAVLVASRFREREPALAVGSALVAWLLLALYVSPWSLMWALPVLALRRDTLVTRALVALFALVLFTTEWGGMTDRYLLSGSVSADVYRQVLGYLVSITIVATIVIAVALLVEAIRRLSREPLRPRAMVGAPASSTLSASGPGRSRV